MHNSPPEESSLILTNRNDPTDFLFQALEDNDISIRQLVHDHLSGRHRIPITFELTQSRSKFWIALEKTLTEPQSVFAYWAELRAQRKREVTSTLPSRRPTLPLDRHGLSDSSCLIEERASRPSPCHFGGTPLQENVTTTSNTLKISADHRLFVLIQCNTLRGAMANMSILLHLNGDHLDGWADIYTEDLPPPPDHAPSSLKPTQLQKAIPHESWIDVLPYPVMRDNILLNQDVLDEDRLCEDMVGGVHEGFSDVQNRGLILWGDPWSEDGWEISEGFALKWEFLLRGCDALMEATNKWREARGEDRLTLEI